MGDKQSEGTCTGCEFHAECAAAILGVLGSPDIWGVQSGTETRPDCHKWKAQDAARKAERGT